MALSVLAWLGLGCELPEPLGDGDGDADEGGADDDDCEFDELAAASGAAGAQPVRAAPPKKTRAPNATSVRIAGEVENAIATHSCELLLESTTVPGDWPIGAGL